MKMAGTGRLLRYGVLLCLLAWILMKVDWGTFASAWSRASFPLVLAPFALIHLSLLWSALRWKTLLKAQGHSAPTRRLYSYLLAGLFANNFMPSSVGGDVVRMWLVKRETGDSASASAGVLVDRLSGVIALLCVLGLGVALRPDLLTVGRNEWIAITGLGGLIAGLLLIRMLIRMNRAGEDSQGEGFLARGANWLRRVLAAIAYFRGHPGALAAAFGWSLVFHLTAVGVHAAAFAALGLAVAPTTLLFIVPLVNVAGMLPVTPNGYGLQDALYMKEFDWAGHLPEDALAVFLLVRLSLLVTGLMGAGVFGRSRKASEAGKATHVNS